MRLLPRGVGIRIKIRILGADSSSICDMLLVMCTVPYRARGIVERQISGTEVQMQTCAAMSVLGFDMPLTCTADKDIGLVFDCHKIIISMRFGPYRTTISEVPVYCAIHRVF